MPSQSLWQSDLRIKSFSLSKSGGYRILSISISNIGNNGARCPKLILNLPVNTKVNGINLPSTGEDIPYHVLGIGSQILAPGYQPEIKDACIVFDLPNLSTSAHLDFRVSYVEVESGLQTNSEASVFIYSATPDMNKENNYKTIAVD